MKEFSVSDAVYQRLTEWIGAEDIDVAISKLLDGADRIGEVAWDRESGRSARSAYYQPVLAAIRDNGGTATVGVIVKEVGKRMSDQFLAEDVQFLPSGGPRWQKEVGFAGEQLGQLGLIEKLDKPRGRWRLTERGEAYLDGTGGS